MFVTRGVVELVGVFVGVLVIVFVGVLVGTGVFVGVLVTLGVKLGVTVAVGEVVGVGVGQLTEVCVLNRLSPRIQNNAGGSGGVSTASIHCALVPIGATGLLYKNDKS